jgi:uncharacterized protein HemY
MNHAHGLIGTVFTVQKLVRKKERTRVKRDEASCGVLSFLMEEADSGGLMVWWENISSAPSRLVAKALQ